MTGRFGELLLILLIIFVIFGAGRLPKVMAQFGKSIKILKRGMQENEKEDDKSS